MTRSRVQSQGKATANLMVRLEPRAKKVIAQAAELRHISTSDYVRSVVVAQAERELEQAKESTVGLTPAEQLAFWQALHEPVKLTERQKQLGKLMQGLV